MNACCHFDQREKSERDICTDFSVEDCFEMTYMDFIEIVLHKLSFDGY